MKRMMLVFVVVMLVAISVVGIAGCAVFHEDPEKHTKRLLKEKYNEEFEVLTTWGNGGKAYGALCYPVRDKSLFFRGSFSMNTDTCDDHYDQAIISQKIQEMYTVEFKKIFNECYVHAGIVSQYSKITNTVDITIENFIEATGIPAIVFYIGINSEKYMEDDYVKEYTMLEALMRDAESLGFDTSIGLYFLSDEEYQQFKQYFATHDSSEGGVDEVVNGKVEIGFGYANGAIKLSEKEYEKKRKAQ